MKLYIIVFLIIFFNVTCESQNQSGVLRYKGIVLATKTDTIKNQRLKETIALFNTNTQEVLYELRFNHDESIFSAIENVDIDQSHEYLISKILQDGSGIYYSNIHEKYFLIKKENYGEIFIIKQPNYVWELNSESKKIGDFTCQKATTFYEVNNSIGSFKHKVTAWYTAQIPISFGVKGFNGLPGVIVQIDIHNAVFLLTEINFNSKQTILINKPIKGINITKKEFEKIGLEKRFKN